jgi:hypothetical protein
MLPLEMGGNGLLWLILFVFAIIGIVGFLISLLGVFIYSQIKGVKYTTKEFLMRTIATTFILLLISGFVCGTLRF